MAGSALASLANELATFEQERSRLIAAGEEGRWVLIHGNQVVGTWETCGDAVQVGHERFGLEPFLVDRIQTEPRVVRVSRLYR
jgi:hypothetical protein